MDIVSARPQKRVLRAASRLRTAQSGAIAIFMGLLAGVLFVSAGMAIDYSRILRAQTALQAMLDAAVLAAVQQSDMTGAKSVFDGYIAAKAVSGQVPDSLQAQIESFDGITLRAKAEMSFPMTIGSLVWPEGIELHANAGAQRGGSHHDLYFALDLSGSLGMGATQQDREALEALTQPYVSSFYGSSLPQGCAFACHRREGWEPDNKTVYQMAREAGIKVREDELVHQFDGLVDLLLDPNDDAVRRGMRRIAVTAFSRVAEELAAPSSSATDVKSVLSDFAITNRYETTYADAFATFTSQLGTQGSGTQSNPVKMLIIVTDGIESRDAFFSQRAIDVSLCSAIKSQGFRIAVVELKYPKLVANRLYDDTVLPIEDTISPALEQCASTGWYFQAVDNADVPAKFAELKEQISTTAVHLTH